MEGGCWAEGVCSATDLMETPPFPLSSRAKPRDLRFNGPVLEMFLATAKRNGWRNRQPFPVNHSQRLPVSTTAAAVAATAAAVESATTTAAAMESTTAAHAATVVPAAATKAAAAAVVSTGCAACEPMSAGAIASRTVVEVVSCASVAHSATVAYPTAIASPAVVPAAAIVSTPAIVPTATPVSVIPGAGTDEDAADEPARAIVAIGCTGIGVIIVITPGTYRRGVPVTIIPIPGADADAHADLGISRSRHQR